MLRMLHLALVEVMVTVLKTLIVLETLVVRETLVTLETLVVLETVAAWMFSGAGCVERIWRNYTGFGLAVSAGTDVAAVC